MSGIKKGADPDIFFCRSESIAGLLYATFFGFNVAEEIGGLRVDGDGNIYLAGETQSTEFPTTPDAIQSYQLGSFSTSAFLSELNPSGSALVFSTLLPGSTALLARGIQGSLA